MAALQGLLPPVPTNLLPAHRHDLCANPTCPTAGRPDAAVAAAGIASAPLWDGEQGRVSGMLSASDFIHMLQVRRGRGAGPVGPRWRRCTTRASAVCHREPPSVGCCQPHPAPCPPACPSPQRLRSVVSSSANPMSEQEMDLHTIRWARVQGRVGAGGKAASSGHPVSCLAGQPLAAACCLTCPRVHTLTATRSGLREELEAEGTQRPRPLVAVRPTDSLASVVRTLFSRGCSMAPVLSSPADAQRGEQTPRAGLSVGARRGGLPLPACELRMLLARWRLTPDAPSSYAGPHGTPGGASANSLQPPQSPGGGQLPPSPTSASAALAESPEGDVLHTATISGVSGWQLGRRQGGCSAGS